MNEPSSKGQIVKALSQTRQEICGYFAELPLEVFFAGSTEKWSPGHHLEHLRLSNKPVATALGAPKLLLRIVAVGKKAHPSRGFPEIVQTYRQALKAGAQATGRYVPGLEADPSEQGRHKIVQGFAKAAEGVELVLAGWSEEALDEYSLPHPVLGQLRVREMLFFTLYHNRHHLEGVRSRQGMV